jgi:hypothetical protein
MKSFLPMEMPHHWSINYNLNKFITLGDFDDFVFNTVTTARLSTWKAIFFLLNTRSHKNTDKAMKYLMTWWYGKCLLKILTGRLFILDDTWLYNFDMQLFTDSSGDIGKGCGYYLFGKWSISSSTL